MKPKGLFASLSAPRLMVAIFLLSIFVMASREITDPDFWWHLRTGQYICEARGIPRRDIFSYTVPDQRWITHEWLTEIVLYAIYSVSGQGGLVLAFAAIITGAFALVYLQCAGRPYLASFVVVWAAITSAMTWGVRPQMLSLLLSATFLYILHLYKRGHRKIIWLMPPLMLLWVNMHGSFLLGLVFPATYIVGETISNLVGRDRSGGLARRDIRLLLLVTLITATVTLANPNGVQLLLYPFGTLGSPAMQAYILEWFSPDFQQIQFQPLALLIILTLVSLALSRRVPSATELLFVAGFGWAALRSARHIPFFALTVAPILTAQLLDAWRRSRWADRFTMGRPRRGTRNVIVNWLVLSVLIFGGAAKIGLTFQENAKTQRRVFPVDAVDFTFKQGITGNMYNLYHWGGYLIWRLYPEQKVFIDGRADVYGDAFIDEYLQAYQVREDWREPLDRYDVGFVIIDEGSSLSTVLHESPDWDRWYADEIATVFIRREGKTW